MDRSLPPPCSPAQTPPPYCPRQIDAADTIGENINRCTAFGRCLTGTVAHHCLADVSYPKTQSRIRARSHTTSTLAGVLAERRRLNESAANFSGDNLNELQITDSNRKLLKRHKSIRRRISKTLDHKFDGTEEAFRRKLRLQTGLKITGLGLLGAAAYSSAITIALATQGAALPLIATMFTSTFTPNAFATATAALKLSSLKEQKYYIDMRPWFKYIVNPGDMELFLKEVPERGDIEKLKTFVGKLNEKLSADNFDQTYKDIKSKLNCIQRFGLRDELKNEVPCIFNSYLECAKERYAAHYRVNVNEV